MCHLLCDSGGLFEEVLCKRNVKGCSGQDVSPSLEYLIEFDSVLSCPEQSSKWTTEVKTSW